MDLPETARYLGVSRSTLYRHIGSPTNDLPPPIRIGARMMWRRETVNRWLDRQERQQRLAA
jgi:predicted DNA-binding transcriptional regulator AlpA